MSGKCMAAKFFTCHSAVARKKAKIKYIYAAFALAFGGRTARHFGSNGRKTSSRCERTRLPMCIQWWRYCYESASSLPMEWSMCIVTQCAEWMDEWQEFVEMRWSEMESRRRKIGWGGRAAKKAHAEASQRLFQQANGSDVNETAMNPVPCRMSKWWRWWWWWWWC